MWLSQPVPGVFLSLCTALLLPQHGGLHTRQGHSAASDGVPDLQRAVYGVCHRGLAVRVQPLHLPLLGGLCAVCQDHAHHHPVSLPLPLGHFYYLNKVKCILITTGSKIATCDSFKLIGFKAKSLN